MVTERKRKRRSQSRSLAADRKHRSKQKLAPKSSYLGDLKHLILAFGMVLAIVSLAIVLTTSFGRMDGYSMLPRINHKSVLTINKVVAVKRFDVIYLKVPHKQGQKSVRRIIGMPGDELDYKNDELTVNQQGKSERYLNDRKNQLIGGLLTEDFTLKDLTGQVKVPANCYFVMGDNRQSSADSRDYGFIEKQAVIGRVEQVIWPLAEFQKIK